MKLEIKHRIDQLNNGEIPNGYKKTEFGIFPCDWVTDKKMKVFASIIQQKYDPNTCPNNPVCIELEHIKGFSGYLYGNSFGKSHDSIKSVFKKGDILFGKLAAAV
ncbi:hypothetical protein [uncultured Fibrobacter sp.]|uniref:hypothetical protein n=1 Tax=uncultured Fibrobacter sp. TaxID=261512 RepID=UPI0025F26068|nr:hypothetical protein [uncultured Fibrobacter sp.]